MRVFWPLEVKLWGFPMMLAMSKEGRSGVDFAECKADLLKETTDAWSWGFKSQPWITALTLNKLSPRNFCYTEVKSCQQPQDGLTRLFFPASPLPFERQLLQRWLLAGYPCRHGSGSCGTPANESVTISRNTLDRNKLNFCLDQVFYLKGCLQHFRGFYHYKIST